MTPPRWAAGRCDVCGSLTATGERRCEIHPAPAWPKLLALVALVAATLALMLVRPEVGGGLRLAWPPW